MIVTKQKLSKRFITGILEHQIDLSSVLGGSTQIVLTRGWGWGWGGWCPDRHAHSERLSRHILMPSHILSGVFLFCSRKKFMSPVLCSRLEM